MSKYSENMSWSKSYGLFTVFELTTSTLFNLHWKFALNLHKSFTVCANLYENLLEPKFKLNNGNLKN